MTDIPAQSPRSDVAVRPDVPAVSHCIFCLEDIKSGASVCPHCGSSLQPLQRLVEDRAVLEARIAALEDEVAALRPMSINLTASAQTASPTSQAPPPAGVFGWPHMADNLFLGLMALLAAHWLATTLPHSDRAVYRLAAFAVAVPFGFRFEAYSRSTPSTQVLVALVFAGLGTLGVGILDMALAGGVPKGVNVDDLVASLVAISLSHLAGSLWAAVRRSHTERAETEAAAEQATGTTLHVATAFAAIRLVKPEKLQSQAAAVKAVTDAAAAIAATAVALWAAVGHILS